MASKLVAAVVVLPLLLCIPSHSLGFRASDVARGLQPSGCTLTDPSFDFHLLALQWPPAYHASAAHWTIHGLWPSRSSAATTYPCACSSAPFDMNALAALLPRLNANWPSLKGDNAEFWQHEWSKHGTCTHWTLFGYFNATLNLRDAYNPGKALAALRPSNTQPYTSAQISAALRLALGKGVMLGCKTSSSQGQPPQQVLSELGLCFSKTLRLFECPPSVLLVRDEVNDCDPALPIYIPQASAAGLVQ